MAKINLNILFVFCLIIEIVFCGDIHENCEQVTPCKCQYSDGSTININNIILSTSSVIESKQSPDIDVTVVNQYFISLCQDHDFVFNHTSIQNECKSTSVCMRTTEYFQMSNGTNTVKNGNYLSYGTIKDAKFVFQQSLPTLYYSKTPTETFIRLVCSQGESVLTITDFSPPKYIFTLYSPMACLTEPTHNHSFGTTLLIIFFVLSLVYLGVGFAVKYFLMGARGVEAIPNYAFWKDYPNLVREGILFIQNGFRPPARSASTPNSIPNPNSYDSI